MKTIAISVFFFITSLLIYPQWIQQNSGTTKSFHNLYFLNENLGWVCGYDGTILKTSDGGQNWISHNLGTLDDVHAIYFKEPSIGWAVLYEYVPDRHGSIIHTTDGGNSWNVQLSEWGNTPSSVGSCSICSSDMINSDSPYPRAINRSAPIPFDSI